MAIYDSIARKYAEMNAQRPLYRHLIYPSFYALIGDVRGLSVLDIMTGEGHVAREMKKRGATYVVGIDESAEMIRLAKWNSGQIGFAQGVVGRLGTVLPGKEFDVCTGAFSLHYAASEHDLSWMLHDVRRNLKPGGVFYTINNNPFHPIGGDSKYQNTVTCDDPPLREGSKLTVHFDGTDVSFPNFHWNWSTYERHFYMAGFTVDFIQMSPTEEGIKLFGYNFWESFLAAPTLVMFRAIKR